MTDKLVQDKQRTQGPAVPADTPLHDVTIEVKLKGEVKQKAEPEHSLDTAIGSSPLVQRAVDLKAAPDVDPGLRVSSRPTLRPTQPPTLKYQRSRWPGPEQAPSAHPPTILDRLMNFIANLIKRLIDAFIMRLSKRPQPQEELNLEELQVCTPKQREIIEEERRRKEEIEREALEYEERIKRQARVPQYYPPKSSEE